MNRAEDPIRDALSADERAVFDGYHDEPSLVDQVTSAFRGRMWLMTLAAVLMSLAMFGASIWCLVKLFQAETALAAVRWATLFGWFSLSVGLIKVWFWLRMNHKVMLREIKRVEVRLVNRAGE